MSYKYAKTGKMTDKDIANLVFKIKADYKKLKDEEIYGSNEIYYNLYHHICEEVMIDKLHLNEQQKVLNILNMLFFGLNEADKDDEPVTYIWHYQPQIIYSYQRIEYATTYRPMFTFGDWMMLNLAFNPPGYSHFHVRGRNSGGTFKDAMIVVALLILLGVALYLTYRMLKLLAGEMKDSWERLVHDEGQLQAITSMIGVAAGIALFAGGVAVGLATVIMPFAAFITAIVVAGIWGAALGGWVSRQLFGMYNRENYQDSIDENDPHRFALTTAQAKHIEQCGADPVKVTAVIALLRAEIGVMPTPTKRFFSESGKDARGLLEKIRQIRHGKVDDWRAVEVGDNTFDCTISKPDYDFSSERNQSPNAGKKDEPQVPECHEFHANNQDIETNAGLTTPPKRPEMTDNRYHEENDNRYNFN